MLNMLQLMQSKKQIKVYETVMFFNAKQKEFRNETSRDSSCHQIYYYHTKQNQQNYAL